MKIIVAFLYFRISLTLSLYIDMKNELYLCIMYTSCCSIAPRLCVDGTIIFCLVFSCCNKHRTKHREAKGAKLSLRAFNHINTTQSSADLCRRCNDSEHRYSKCETIDIECRMPVKRIQLHHIQDDVQYLSNGESTPSPNPRSLSDDFFPVC